MARRSGATGRLAEATRPAGLAATVENMFHSVLARAIGARGEVTKSAIWISDSTSANKV